MVHGARGRRSTVGVVAAIALAAALGACGSSDGTHASVVRSSVARAKAPKAAASQGGEVTRTVAATLWRPIAAQADGGNLAYSPASIAVALGMVRAGAQGASATQLDRFLGAGDPAALHRSLNGLSASLESRSGRVTDDKGQKGAIELAPANSPWGQEGVRWQRPFLDVLAREYGAGMRAVDYVDDTEGARKAVNAWVGDQTHGKIPALIARGVFDDQTRLTLVNALYLAAPWAERFDPVGAKPFTTAAGTRVRAPAMRRSFFTGYARGPGWQAVSVPYAGHDLSMTLLVPDAGKLGAVEADLDPELLARLADLASVGSEAERSVTLTMPRFDLRAEPDLTAALQQVGVTAPFETTTDFRPITTDPEAQPLQLAAVVHQATVEVDERGTVAAAATAAVFEKVGARIDERPPVTLDVDRPFLFVITDDATGAVLFVGRVTDPTRR